MEDDFHLVEFGAEELPNSDEDLEDGEFVSPALSHSKNSDSKNNKNKNNKNVKNKQEKINHEKNNNDEINALKTLKAEISKELLSLKQEKKDVIQLKNELQNKLEENTTMNNEFRVQIQTMNNLHKDLEKEIATCSKLRTNVEAERTNLKLEYEHYQNKNKNTQNEKYQEFETYYQKNENLYNKFNEYYNNINNMNNKINSELESLKKLKQQQQDILNNCQNQLNIIRKTNVNDIITKINDNKNDNNKINDNKNDNNKNHDIVIFNDHLTLEEATKESNNNSNSNNNNDEKNNLVELDKAQAYACKSCGTHISKESEIESKNYQVGQGNFNENKRGFLFKKGYNLELAPIKIENFTTGSYTISWVSCLKCKNQIGWKYLGADNPSNSNKIGKYCLGRSNLTSPAERNDF